MKQNNSEEKLSVNFILPLLFVFSIWLVFSIENTFDLSFVSHGIYPRKLSGLQGILFSPFIHSGFKHIFNNSIPLFVLTYLLFYHYRSVSWKILFWGMLLTGLGTWLIGRPSYHIGMSGIIYMLVSFLFFSGILIRDYRLMAVSMVVVFLYGSLIWFMLPLVPHMSWEGHTSGFISGVILALIYAKKLKKHYPKRNVVIIRPEEEAFLRHFDENGNFIEFSEEKDIKDETSNT